MTPQTNTEKQRISYERRKAAYEAMKALAIELGYMAHERDGTGFDNLIKAIDAGGVKIVLVK